MRIIVHMMVAVLTVVLILSCQKQMKKGEIDALETVSETNNLVPFKYKPLFMVDHQHDFAFTFDDIKKLSLRRIDSVALVELLQGDKLLGYNKNDFQHYYYSFQHSMPEYQAVTVLLNVEYDYRLYYLIYSRKGKLVSKFEVAREGGDGPTSTKEYGAFKNDSIYIKVRVDKEFPEGSNVPVIDSTTFSILIKSDGVIVGGL